MARARDYEDSDENPFADFLATLAEELGGLAGFDYWSPRWDRPGYQLGVAEALAMTGGNEEAAHQITNGFAPLHEMPRAVEAGGAESIAEWAIERAKEYTRENFPDFEDLNFSMGETAND